MNIEKIRELDWKARRDFVKTTDNLEILVLLAVKDKSARVRKEILYRPDLPFEALSEIYKKSSSFNQKIDVLNCLEKRSETEKVRELLNEMFDDKDYEFVILAMKLYRKMFQDIKGIPNLNREISTTDSKEHLEDWVIQMTGFGEAKELAENTNVVQELAHRFVMGEFAFESNKYYFQEFLYKILSHEKIQKRTLQYIFNAKENEGFEEYFYEKPKYAIAICKNASEKMLDLLMDEYESDFEKYFDKSFDRSYIDKYFNIFFSALVSNPNCSKKTFDKAFNLFIERLNIGWGNALSALSGSKFYSVNTLKYMLEHNGKIGKWMMYYSPQLIKEIDPEFLNKVVGNFSEHDKEWILEFVEELPEFLKESLAS